MFTCLQKIKELLLFIIIHYDTINLIKQIEKGLSIMNKLTEKQFNSIINRFTSDTIYPKAFLLHPVRSIQHVIASNSHMALFLSNRLVNDSIHSDRFLTPEEGEQLLSLESKLMDNYTQSPNRLTLDGELIKSIISTLQQHKKELKTRKHAYTYVSYDKSVNEISFSTYVPSKGSPTQKKQSFFLPVNVSDDINDFSILINTSYLIDALETQHVTDQFTSLEHNRNYIRLVNDYSTVIIAKLKG